MLSLANDLIVRAARFIADRRDDGSFWIVSVRGRAMGALACAAGEWRLDWFDRADPRLASFTGPVDGDVAALAETLSLRLGLPVRLDPLAS